MLVFLMLLLGFATPAHAHKGDIDAYGCHHDKKGDGYHCHKHRLKRLERKQSHQERHEEHAAAHAQAKAERKHPHHRVHGHHADEHEEHHHEVQVSEGCTYTVVPGDSLYLVAAAHEVEVDDIVRWTPLADADVVEVGELLYVAEPETCDASEKLVRSDEPPMLAEIPDGAAEVERGLPWWPLFAFIALVLGALGVRRWRRT